MRRVAYPALLILALASTSAFAADETTKGKPRDGTTELVIVEDKMAGKEELGDPNRVICRKEDSTGSRVSARRVCATASEWAARKQHTREGIERAQTQRYKNN